MLRAFHGAVAFAAIALTILATSRAAVAQETTPHWWDTDRPNCQIWIGYPRFDETLTWSGDCANGKAQGFGKLVLSFHDTDGQETYEGTMRDGKRDGQGVRVLVDGNRYEGGWKDNWPHGQGVRILGDGVSFRGPFESGQPHGIGECVTPDGGSGPCEYNQGEFVRWLQ